MDAPEELRRAITEAINDPASRTTYRGQADAVLAVPAIADALARDAQVAEIMRGDPLVVEAVAAIVALYPEGKSR